MIINILTLFPGMVEPILQESIIKRAIESKVLEVNVINFRDFATGRHQQVDDTPFGGGGGMVIKPEPLFECVESIENSGMIIYASPQGVTFNQEIALELAKEEVITFVAGHYEGVDERFIDAKVDLELSIGDYVLTGGELPILVMVDSIARMIPGVIKENSYENDSFFNDRLDYAHYTRPAEYRDMKVPEVLLSGNHVEIERYRKKESLKRTIIRRPDLFEKRDMNKEEEKLIHEMEKELENKGMR